MSFFARSVAAVCVAIVACGGAYAAEEPGVALVTLKNGLQVVVIPDRRAPVVTHMVWYRVGGMDDPEGLSGLAHFFEHLMFKGTKKTAPGELSKIVARNGGGDNAFTTHDYTAYFQRIAKDRLGLVMGLEADRMANLDLSEDNVRTERDVVLEERRYRVDGDPTSLLVEQMQAALHLSHPYGRPVIGWAEEVGGIERAEAIDFYGHHYAPNNAILIVAGDVEPDEVLALAKKNYGGVRARELAGRVKAAEPPRIAETRIAMARADAKLPTFLRLYRVPSYVGAAPGEAEALEVLSQVLGGGPTSRLYRALVEDKKIASSAGAWYDGMARDAAVFGIYAYPRDGVSFAAIEKAVDEVLQWAATEAPGGKEFDRVKTVLVASAVYSRDSQSTMARVYGEALSIGMTVDDVRQWPDRIRAVAAPDVRDAVAKHLRRTEAVTGTLSPKAQP